MSRFHAELYIWLILCLLHSLVSILKTDFQFLKLIMKTLTLKNQYDEKVSFLICNSF